MNIINCSSDPRSEELDKMIQRLLEKPGYHLFEEKDKIVDLIMKNPDLALTTNQIVFLLQNSTPAISPMRKDYYDVYARLVCEAKGTGDARLVKHVYLSMPFYPDDPDNARKWEFFQNGIQYFLLLGMNQIVGELYLHLAAMYHGSTKERIQLCEQAMKYLDRTSKEYVCIVAMREMLCHMGAQEEELYYRYCAFGGTIFLKGESIFLSSIYPCFSFRKKEESVCSDVAMLKGNKESYKSLDSFDSYGYDKEVIDETLPVGTSKTLFAEKELLRHPDETIICQADGKAYDCRVFTIKRAVSSGEKIWGDIIETNYYASGIGPIRTVICVDDQKYVYDLCEYFIQGGEGWIPCCVGNLWCYKQENCPDDIDQVIRREIIGQNGEEYLISGWNYAGRNSCKGDDA